MLHTNATPLFKSSLTLKRNCLRLINYLDTNWNFEKYFRNNYTRAFVGQIFTKLFLV